MEMAQQPPDIPLSYIIAFGSSPSNSDQRYYLHIFALAHIVPPQGDMWDFQPIGNVLSENSGFYLKFFSDVEQVLVLSQCLPQSLGL